MIFFLSLDKTQYLYKEKIASESLNSSSPPLTILLHQLELPIFPVGCFFFFFILLSIFLSYPCSGESVTSTTAITINKLSEYSSISEINNRVSQLFKPKGSKQ